MADAGAASTPCAGPIASATTPHMKIADDDNSKPIV